jgi:hypothetical protein
MYCHLDDVFTSKDVKLSLFLMFVIVNSERKLQANVAEVIGLIKLPFSSNSILEIDGLFFLEKSLAIL